MGGLEQAGAVSPDSCKGQDWEQRVERDIA